MKKKKRIISVLVGLMLLTGCGGKQQKETVDLNSLTLDQIIEKAKEEGKVESVGMPDGWANWEGTWAGIKNTYGLEHTDTDLSSAEELALFESEKDNATKDIGDVGQSFGPVAKEQGLTLPYKTTHWDSIPDWAKDDDGDWVIAYSGTISFITNKNLVKDTPTSFKDILEGDYKVSIGDVTTGTQQQCAVLAAVANGGSESNIQPGIDFFRTLAKQGRLDKGEWSLSRLEKGEIAVAIIWDFTALGYRSQIQSRNPNANYEVCIPSDGSVQSGYTTIINSYSSRPHAAALTREYILSDEGQINLARGYTRPIRAENDLELPDDVKNLLLPDVQYKNVHKIEDQEAWKNSVQTLIDTWQEDVMAYMK